jgi:hypothetical protein
MTVTYKNQWGRSLALLTLLLLMGCEDPKPTPPVPGKEDPIVQVVVPGAYGVPGGTQVYNADRHQLSTLECPDGTLTFRLLDPGERKVLSLYGIPSQLREGEHISFRFRTMVNGYTLQSEEYTDVLVLKLTPDGIWLKKNESTYFVLSR